MNPIIDLGGHAIKITDDQYSDGRKCVVAEHPDLPGCVVYADTRDAALELLAEARAAYTASVRRHEGSATPVASRPAIIRVATSSSGAGLSLQTA